MEHITNDSLAYTCMGSLGLSLDRRLICVLRDGKKLIGYLKSFDQFGNLILQDTVERIYTDIVYADISRGIFIIRGDNIVYLGELGADSESNMKLKKVSIEEAFIRQKEMREQQQLKLKRKNHALHELGFIVETGEEELLWIYLIYRVVTKVNN